MLNVFPVYGLIFGSNSPNYHIFQVYLNFEKSGEFQPEFTECQMQFKN